jgi:histidinol-phosphate aminotransferase
MGLSRRTFVRAVGLGGAGVFSDAFASARGREALSSLAPDAALAVPEPHAVISIGGNTNNYGPGQAALAAVRDLIGPIVGRYPGNRRELAAALALRYGVKTENVLLGVGSTEIVRGAVIAFTSPSRHLVVASPTWEDPGIVAVQNKARVKAVPVDPALKVDLDAMVEAAEGAGLVYLCNPNNPTATVHPAKSIISFVERVLAKSPQTTILIDEAYQDFVIDPSHATAVPLSMQHERVLVTRTMSKAHGMAGLRLGYGIGHPMTLEAVGAYRSLLLRENERNQSINWLSAAAAIASIKDPANIERQRALNRKAIELTVSTFKAAGCHVGDPQANFIFADVHRPAKDFRAACAEQGVMIGRDFPPLVTYARISMGTFDEMQRANEVFRTVLGSAPTAAED